MEGTEHLFSYEVRSVTTIGKKVDTDRSIVVSGVKDDDVVGPVRRYPSDNFFYEVALGIDHDAAAPGFHVLDDQIQDDRGLS
jgi:hypothetical protein